MLLAFSIQNIRWLIMCSKCRHHFSSRLCFVTKQEILVVLWGLLVLLVLMVLIVLLVLMVWLVLLNKVVQGSEAIFWLLLIIR